MPTGELWCRVAIVGPNGAELGTWQLSGTGAPQLVIVDCLARMQMAAGRVGGRAIIGDLCPDLAELLQLVGLSRELSRQPEEGEDPFSVEEEVETGDPSV